MTARNPPDPPGQVVQVYRCAPCRGEGGWHEEVQTGYYSRGLEWTRCRACGGSGVAAERIVPACAEPFPLARD